MADTARKKSSSLDQSHASKGKQKGVEKEIHSKQVITGPKPPLPPRPAGLSKRHPGRKKISSASKSPQQLKETKSNTEDHLDEDCSPAKPRHPPPPLSSFNTAGDINEAKGEGEETKTKETENVSSPQSPGNDTTSKDGSVHQEYAGSGLDTPGVSINTNVEHLESSDAEISQDSSLENITERKILMEAIVTTQRPTRPENPKNVNIESSSVSTSSQLPGILEPLSTTTSRIPKTKEEEMCSTAGKTAQTPERPKPPRMARAPSVTATSVDRSNSLDTNTITQDKMRSTTTPEKPKPPKFPKTPKVSPPVPPKPDHSRAEKKSKYNKPLNNHEKPSPPVQRRTSKFQPPARPKAPEVAGPSEVVKEKNTNAEKTRSFDVEASCEDKATLLSVEKTSSLAEITPHRTEVISAIPGNKSKVITKEPELTKKMLPSNVNSAHEQAKPLPPEEKRARPVFPKRTKMSKEKRFEANSMESRKEVKPSRPRVPSRKMENVSGEKISESHDNSLILDSQNIPVKSTVDRRSGEVITHVSGDEQFTTSENNKTKTVPRPTRPSRPKLSHDNSALPVNQNFSMKPKVDEQSCEVFTQVSEDVQITTSDSNKTETVASSRPSRPSKPKLSHDDSALPDNQNIHVKPMIDEQACVVTTHRPEDDQKVISENSKTETVASPRPSKLSHENSSVPDNQNISVKPTVDQQSCEVFEDVPEEVQIATSESKTDIEASPRPSKPKHPPELSKTSETVESNTSDDANEHDKSGKRKNVDKPQRPSQPKLPSESALRRESASSFKSSPQENERKPSSILDDVPQTPVVSGKPQRPCKPKLPSEMTVAEETEISSVDNISTGDLEALRHKTVTSEKPSRPVRPDKMITPQKQTTKSEKHENISENNPSLKKSFPGKPFRPPKPKTNDISPDISPLKPQTSLMSTREETTKLARPPRPQAPHPVNEKDKHLSVDKEISGETPPKPRRTVSENDNLDMQQSEPQEDNISDQPTGETKLPENSQKPPQSVEENKDRLNENIVHEPGKVIVIKENDNNGKEVRNVEQEQCETTGTNDISGKDNSELTEASLEQSKSFKLSSPPFTSRTNCGQKEETQNAPFIEVRRRSKDLQETESDKSSERHGVRFRVSSLSKTEVESFNKKDFLEKLKNKEGRIRRKSEEDSKSSVFSVLKPKPSRPPPPQPSNEITEIIEKDKNKKKVEVHGTESSDVIASGDVIASNDELETIDVTFGSTTDKAVKPGKEEDSPVKENGNLSGAFICEDKVREVASTEKTNTKLTERKIKRKAPPEPGYTEEQRGPEERLGIERSLEEKNDQLPGNIETPNLNVKKEETEITQGQVVPDMESKSELLSAGEQVTVESIENNSDGKDSTADDLIDKQSKNEAKIENNNLLKEELAKNTTIEHQVITVDNDVCVQPIVTTPVETGKPLDKEVPVVAQLCFLSESLPASGNVSRGVVTDEEVKKLRVCEDSSNSYENTVICSEILSTSVVATQPPCDKPSVSTKKSEREIPVSSGKSESPSIVNVETKKKKKAPPPKPKRTSSLKTDPKLIVPKNETSKEEVPDSPKTKDKRSISPESLMKISEEKEAEQQTNVASKAILKEPPVPPAKAVTFDDKTQGATSQPSKLVSRSKSFASPGKNRVNTTGIPGKDVSRLQREGLSRSQSFGAKIRSINQPPRPRPPTFYLEETKNNESAEKDSDVETGLVREEHSDDVIKVELTSSSQEDFVESGSSQNDNKHDGFLTTDSESENEKDDEPQKSKTYYISREILSTERTFVDAVKLVSEDFREVVNEGNKKFGRAIIPDETLHDIVLNISQIYKFDREFLKALEGRMETWDEEQRIGDIIKRFSPFLKMYKTYIQGYDNAMAVLSEALKKYPQFAEVVREFECSERCQHLTVGMYMLKPIQRIPSYRLLLIDYLKHLSKDSLDYKDVSDALAIVSEVATHINEDMKRVDNFEEVLKVQRSLVGQVEIVKPGRELIKEGALMKLCRKDMQPRMFYLLTDVLLYTTPVANNQFRLNLSLPLEEIKVEIPVSPDFDNEFSIISTKKSFILSASTAEERDEWLEALRNASDEIRKKKISFHLAKKEKMDALFDAQTEDDKEAKLGSKAPVWIPDIRVSMCMVCTDDFTVTNRRHHCRACGKVICGSCSSNSAPLTYLNDETARVCDVCYDELTADKTTSTQTGVETKENGISSERNEPATKINPSKKSKKTQKFKSKEVPAVEESNISGYLRTRVGKKWLKRWYVVKDNVLFASKASSDVAAQETRPLLGYDVRGPDKMADDSKKIVFQLIHAGTEPVVLQTDNMKSAERWVTALRRATILPRE